MIQSRMLGNSPPDQAITSGKKLKQDFYKINDD